MNPFWMPIGAELMAASSLLPAAIEGPELPSFCLLTNEYAGAGNR